MPKNLRKYVHNFLVGGGGWGAENEKKRMEKISLVSSDMPSNALGSRQSLVGKVDIL